jgi:hypothetical protein
MFKKLIPITILLFLFLNSRAQFKIGFNISGGINGTQVNSLFNKIVLNYRDYLGYGSSYTMLPCYRAGIIVHKNLSEKFNLRSGAEYMNKRIRLYSAGKMVSTDVDYHYVRNQFNLEKKISAHLFIMTGISINYLIHTEIKETWMQIFIKKECINPVNLSANAGIGYKIGEKFNIVLDAEYDITPYYKVTEYDHYKYKFRFYNLNLGFQYYFYEKPSKK